MGNSRPNISMVPEYDRKADAEDPQSENFQISDGFIFCEREQITSKSYAGFPLNISVTNYFQVLSETKRGNDLPLVMLEKEENETSASKRHKNLAERSMRDECHTQFYALMQIIWSPPCTSLQF